MENFFSDLKQTFNSAVKKSGELVELGKAKFSVADTKSSIQARYALLGELAYLTAKGEEVAAEDAEKIVAEIDELKAALAEHETKAAELAGKKVCENCGKSCPNDAAFCASCGNPFAVAEEE